MMEVITMGTNEAISALKEKVSCEIVQTKNKNLNIDIQLAKQGKVAILGFQLKHDYQNPYEEDNKKNFTKYLAKNITDFILNFWENKLIKNIINEEYFFFSLQEKEKIYQRSMEIAKIGNPNRTKTLVYDLNRQSKIYNRIIEYLEYSNEINIEGFINFRLKDYIKELNDAVNYAVDEHMLEREYNEFIRLLKYFVDLQEPQLPLVHLVVNESGKYLLYDDQQKEVSNQYMDDFFNEITDVSIDQEDLLISALITIAPSKIHLHFPHENPISDETIMTIEQVFTDAVEFCYGCTWCNNIKTKNN